MDGSRALVLWCLAAAFVVVVLVTVVRVTCSMAKREREAFGDEPIRLLHVRPAADVVLRADEWRGPGVAQLSAVPAVAGLARKRLVVVPASSGRSCDLEVTDAALRELDLPADVRGAGGDLVLPLLGGAFLRALVLFGPAEGPGALEADPALHPAPPRPLDVLCPGDFEARLFADAWAVAGGGDVAGADSAARARVVSVGRGYGVPAAAGAAKATRAAVAVAWGAEGSPAVEAARRAAAAWSTSGKARVVSYHPADVPGPGPKPRTPQQGRAQADAEIAAPHVAKARAPALQLRRVGWLGGGLGALTAPALVALCPGRRPSEQASDAAAELARDAFARSGGARGEANEALAWSSFLHAAARVPLLPEVAEMARRSVDHVMAVVGSDPYSRPAVPVLEQFAVAPDGPHGGAAGAQGPAVELQPGRNVEGTFLPSRAPGRPDALAVDARLHSADLDGVRLRRGDRVVLSRQWPRADAENGTYVVVRVDGGGAEMTTRVKLSPKAYRTALAALPAAQAGAAPPAPRPSPQTPVTQPPTRWAWRFAFDSADDPNGDLATRVGAAVIWLPTQSAGSVVAASATASGGFGVVVEVLAEDVRADRAAEAFERGWMHKLAICSEDATVPTRPLCAQRGGVWDHPCERDDECPFFRAEESGGSAATYRGGCAAGYCEMPVGVQRVGFRHYGDAHTHGRAQEDARAPAGVCACADWSAVAAASHACCAEPGSRGFLFDMQNV